MVTSVSSVVTPYQECNGLSLSQFLVLVQLGPSVASYSATSAARSVAAEPDWAFAGIPVADAISKASAIEPAQTPGLRRLERVLPVGDKCHRSTNDGL